MKKKLLKIINLLAVAVLMTVATVSPVSAQNSTGKGEFKVEKLEKKEGENGSKTIDTTVINENGEKHDFNIVKNKNKTIVTQRIEGKLTVKSVYDKKKGIVTEKYANGEKIVYDIDDLVKVEKDTKKVDTLSKTSDKVTTYAVVPGGGGGSWSLIDSKYSSAWGEYGYLYEKVVETDTTYKQFSIGAGTAVTTALSIIEIIWTKGALTAIFKTIGYTFFGSTLDYYFSGSIDAVRERHHLEGYSQGELGIRTYRDVIRAVIRDNKGNVAYPVISDGGDTRSNNELLDSAIYFVEVIL